MNKRRTLLISSIIFVGVFNAVLKVGEVKAIDPIYIRADGSVDPPSAPISNFDNSTYTFIDDINNSIVVERDNIVIDGGNHIVKGTLNGNGISLSERVNVTMKNAEITTFQNGIYISESSNCNISRNIVRANDHYGIWLFSSPQNSIVENNVTANGWHGIHLLWSSNNSVIENNISASYWIGLWLDGSSNNNIIGNTFNSDGALFEDSYGNTVEGNIVNKKPLIYLENVSNQTVNDAGQVLLINCFGVRVENLNLSDTAVGIELWQTNSCRITGNNVSANHFFGIRLHNSSSNSIYHNNFVGNPHQVYSYGSTNSWDDGYPSGGNYWSDYEGRYSNATEIGDSGIWNMPYVIDTNVQDNYPLIAQYQNPESPIIMLVLLFTATLFIIAALVTIIIYRRKRSASRSGIKQRKGGPQLCHS
jgi:parallel beta-helix repeat protein